MFIVSAKAGKWLYD
ncbi:TPA: DUF1493 family protein [Klebsiella variicola]|nr:DUF1493 family protein [Klebsiella variicola]